MSKENSDKAKPKNNNPGPLVAGRDYYMEKGMFVLTAYYLKNRGYCCGSGCRHCPYPPSTPS